MPDIPILSFNSQKAWADWLHSNHNTFPGIWIRFYKKNSGVDTVTYDDALEIALCYGWIDSLVNKYDELSYIQKFTPRKPKSIWSKRNTEKVEVLIKAGLMQPAGYEQIELAKADGRWDAAYNSSSNMTFPDEFLTALSKNKKAQMFFDTLNKTNKYAIAWRLETAKKPETKMRRMHQILEMLEKEEKFH
jgi:uncharacterized protein YdeI (YjbR/CyaY-like superfamily)